ncbi:D-aspartate oxidase [Achlya hypogyna]|uniref:D-aspartate oxidase n=1 Tax=Achlya hypogyna TaxID=1202772 RepID=A0A1V9YYD0_ACHHY|nr:D-aspartate oxidase [Achlya hypogyna]
MQIIVVGAGVIGLASAMALLEAGHAHVTIVAESFDDTTSHVAGAIWRPFALSKNSSTASIDRWGHATMLWLTKLMEMHGTDAVGIQRTEGREYHDEPSVAHPYWAHSVDGFRFLTREEAQSKGALYGCAYTTLMVHPGKLLPWMRVHIERLGGRFEQRHVASLDDLQCDVIVNCTGMGAKTLVGDTSVYPVRGQTIKVTNPAVTQFCMHEVNHVYTYILPRPGGEVVIGGTVQAHNYSTSCNQADIDAILGRAIKLNPAVAESKIVGTKAGLRPQTATGVVLRPDPRRTRRVGTPFIEAVPKKYSNGFRVPSYDLCTDSCCTSPQCLQFRRLRR